MKDNNKNRKLLSIRKKNSLRYCTRLMIQNNIIRSAKVYLIGETSETGVRVKMYSYAAVPCKIPEKIELNIKGCNDHESHL